MAEAIRNEFKVYDKDGDIHFERVVVEKFNSSEYLTTLSQFGIQVEKGKESIKKMEAEYKEMSKFKDVAEKIRKEEIDKMRAERTKAMEDEKKKAK